MLFVITPSKNVFVVICHVCIKLVCGVEGGFFSYKYVYFCKLKDFNFAQMQNLFKTGKSAIDPQAGESFCLRVTI